MPTTPNIQVRNSLMYLLALQSQVHPTSWLISSNTSTSEDKPAQERWCCCIAPGRQHFQIQKLLHSWLGCACYGGCLFLSQRH